MALVYALVGLLGLPAALAAPNPAKLQLQSSSALVMDVGTGKTLYQKNATRVRPIASITKLMTALVVLDARQDLGQTLTIDQNDRDAIKHTYSRNRMASALARHYPGGRPAFVRAMNNKAKQLGMRNSRFYDSTGLSTRNVSTAQDLAKLIAAAYRQPLIREFTQDTSKDMRFRTPAYSLMFNNTNPLVKNPDWDVRLSKTGFTDEAGRCLLMRAKPDNRETGHRAAQLGGQTHPGRRCQPHPQVAEKLIPHCGDEKGCCSILFYCPQTASALIWGQ
ncbi:UNVERIFIED_CONTAM: hypothetical protein K2H54_000058 [Gekko kuhli]